ncbi:hypothetical protein ACN28S_05525 [Cystobacter fuscus]
MRASIEKISSLVERLGIACDFQRLPGYRYAETEDEARQLEHEARRPGGRACCAR